MCVYIIIIIYYYIIIVFYIKLLFLYSQYLWTQLDGYYTNEIPKLLLLRRRTVKRRHNYESAARGRGFSAIILLGGDGDGSGSGGLGNAADTQ